MVVGKVKAHRLGAFHG